MEIVLNERDCKTPFVAQRRVHIAVIFVIRVRTTASSDRFSLSGDEEVRDIAFCYSKKSKESPLPGKARLD